MRDLADNRDTVRNIRLWDYRPLLRTFRQIQQIRLYYQFYDVDVDRYRLADGYRQTMLAARELTPELPERAETWVNRHLQYTHGYGFAMSLAAQEGEEGTPTLVVKDLPPVATRDAPVGNPAIYYGEHMPDYVIVPSGIRELDYPSGDDNVYASYRGAGGVPLGSLWSRLLFAFHLMDVNILLTDYTTEASRIQIRRSLQDRVHRIAPFLRLDRDPYMVTTPEGLYWIQDAYTTSDRYPVFRAVPTRPRRARPGAVQLHPQQREGGDGRLRRLGRPLRHGPRRPGARAPTAVPSPSCSARSQTCPRGCARTCATRRTSSRRRSPATPPTTCGTRRCSTTARTSGRSRWRSSATPPSRWSRTTS